MATLTGNTIKDTYQSLLKVNDNGELAATLQEITDGVGNGSGVSLNTTGDLKAEGTIEFGSLKDTGEAITITKFVDEADGIANNDNDTSIPTSAAIIDYVAAKITEEDLDFAGDSGTGSVDLDSQIFTIGGTANQIETTATGQSLTIAFPSAGVVLPDGSTATTQAVSDDSTKVATTAYVKSVLTQEDLDFQGDTGTGSVDLDSEVLDIAGGTGIDTVASGQTLTVNIDSTVATLTGTQTLTNKTINADNNTISNLEVDNLKAGVLDTDLTTVSASDDTLASAKAIKTYVDSQVTAQDLDITDGTTTSSVDLDSETMTIQGTANEVEVSLTDQTFTVGLPDTINVNVSGNITGDITGNADTATALQTARDIALSGDVAGSASFDGTTNITISATIQADSVALGTDTTGDYVANLGTGTGVTIGSNTGEGSQPTISVDYGSTANTAVQGNTEITINGTTNEIEITGTANQALGGAPSYTIGLPDDVTIGGSLIVSNDLTVNGTTTTVNTQTLSVEDPLIALAIANAANSVDTGFYAKYSLDSGVTTKFAGLFKDASDTDTFKLFKGLEVEPTTTVNTSGTGYALADLQVAGLEATTITKTGGASTEFLKADGSVDSNTYLTAESDTLDAVTTRGNTTSNSIQVGAATVTGDLTVDTNNLYVDSTNNRVGIGTVSPSRQLTVENSGNAIVSIKSGTTSSSFLLLGDTDADNIGMIKYDNSNNQLEFFANSASTQRLVIANNGNVGIGTVSSPTRKFVVSRDNASSIIGSFQSENNQGVITFVGSATSSDTQVRIGAEANDLLMYAGNAERVRIYSGGDISFRDTSNNEAFYWDASAARLGIGVGASPSAALDVLGSAKIGPNRQSIFSESNGNNSAIIFSSTGNMEFRGSETDYNQLFLKSGGNVGIGTTNPTGLLSAKGSNAEIHLQPNADTEYTALTFRNAANNSSKGFVLYNYANNYMSFRTNGAGEAVRIDSSGNVGIGTSPSVKLHVVDTTTLVGAFASNSAVRTELAVDNTSTNNVRLGLKATPSGAIIDSTNNAGSNIQPLLFQMSGSEKMRITSAGEFYIGTTSTSVSNGAFTFRSIGATNTFLDIGHKTGSTSGASFAVFRYNGTQIGDIAQNGTTGVSFNTTSDYRLKENVVPMEGALDRVDALKPSRFNFIADADKTVDGFLAHEVAEVVPEAISGEKDAMETQEYEVSPAVYEDVVHPAVEEVLDDDGNVVTSAQEEYTERVLVSEAVMGTREVPVYQGIDQSKLVPLLTAALQEAHTLIKELTARVEALESN